MKKLKGLFKLLRFELPFAAGICVVMGQLLALGDFASLSILISGFLSIFMISSSILVFNDYFDLETDRINAPYRPIPSGLVSPGEAKIFAIILMICGLQISAFINFTVFLISFLLALVGLLYNRYFKKSGLPGNIMVSFSVGMTFIYGGATVDLPLSKSVVFFGLISALIDLGEEIAADSMDMDGDRIINSNSIAIKYGKTKAIQLSSIIFFIVILLSFIPFLLGWFSIKYMLAILIMDFFIGFNTIKLRKSENEEGRKQIRQIYLGSTLALVLFLLMKYFDM